MCFYLLMGLKILTHGTQQEQGGKQEVAEVYVQWGGSGIRCAVRDFETSEG